MGTRAGRRGRSRRRRKHVGGAPRWGGRPDIEVGDVVSVTADGRVTLGSHLMPTRHPVDDYLTAMAPLASSPLDLPEDCTVAVAPIEDTSAQSSTK